MNTITLALAEQVEASDIEPNSVLTLLQEAGIASDNCTCLEDMAREDQQRATEWLERLNAGELA